MAARRISGLPVVDEHGTLIGMMSEGDVLAGTRALASARYGGSTCWPKALSSHLISCETVQEQRRKIKTLMSTNPITVTETTPAREIASLMHAHGIKRVPVMRDGKLVGIVTRTDLVRALAQKLSETEPPAAPPNQPGRGIATRKGGGDRRCTIIVRLPPMSHKIGRERGSKGLLSGSGKPAQWWGRDEGRLLPLDVLLARTAPVIEGDAATEFLADVIVEGRSHSAD